MAQILKFSNGGKSTNNNNWGTFTINNTEYQMTDDNIQKLYDHAKTLNPDERYQFDFIIKALESGENLKYANNTLYGNVSFDTSKGQEDKMSKKVARGSGKGKDARLAISSLDNLSFSNPVPEKKSLNFNSRVVEYERDEKGNFVLDGENKKYIKGANNQSVIDFLNTIKDYSVNSEDFDVIGLTDKDANYIRNWYTNYGNENFDALLSRIKTGNWNNSDIELLNDFNITLGQDLTSAQFEAKKKHDEELEEASKKAKANEVATATSKIYADAGFSQTNQYIIYDDASKSFKFSTPELANQINSFGNAIWLNDDFVKANPTYAPLIKGHDNGIFVINGEIYDGNDKRLLENKLFKEFAKHNRHNPESNRHIKQKWTTNSDDWRNYNTFNGIDYYTGISDGLVKDITGNYNLTPWGDYYMNHLFISIPKDATDDMFDMYGNLKPEHYHYWSLDKDGLYKMNDLSGFNDYLTSLQPASDIQRNQYYSNIPSYLKYKYITGSDKIVDLGTDNNGVQYYYNTDTNQVVVKDKNKNYLLTTISLEGIQTKGFPTNIEDHLAINTNGQYVGVNMSNYFKQGGKILKAQNGLTPKWWKQNKHLQDLAIEINTALESGQFPKYESSLEKAFNGEEIIDFNAQKMLDAINKYHNNGLGFVEWSLSPEHVDDIQKQRQLKLNKDEQSIKAQYGSNKNESKKHSFFLSPELALSAADFITSLVGTKASTDKQKEAIYHNMIGSMKQNVSEIYPIFTDNGLGRQYANRIAQIKLYKPVSSDVGQTNSQLLQRQLVADQIQSEANTAISQAKDKYNLELLNKKLYYNQLRNNIANENWKMWNAGLAQMDMADANKINTYTQSIKNLIYNIRENYAKDIEAQQQLDMMNIDNEIMSAAKKEWGTKYNFDQIKDPTLRQAFIDKGDWFGAFKYIDPTAYKNYYLDIIKRIKNNPRYRYDFTGLSTIGWNKFKKGGRINKIGDSILLSQNRFIQKSSENLNKDLIKLFTKIMK